MNFINMLNYLTHLISICPAYALYSTLRQAIVCSSARGGCEQELLG